MSTRPCIDYTIDRLGRTTCAHRRPTGTTAELNCFSETPGESFQTTENGVGSGRIGLHRGLFVLAAMTGRDRDQLTDDAMAAAAAAANRCHAVERDGWDGAWFRVL